VIQIGTTDLEVYPICLGGNVFGWTADERGSFAVLDAYADAGGNFIDTADSYCEWADGAVGGESETIIGRWLAGRGRRDEIVVATKVGQSSHRPGLSAGAVHTAARHSLGRLRTDYIDLYYAHEDDPDTPLEETLAAFDDLVRDGLVRHVAASNYSAPRLALAIAVAAREGRSPFTAMQVHYNLVHREEYEPELEPLCREHGLTCVAYAALADGFLTGKYRPGAPTPASERVEDAAPYLEGPGTDVLEALDTVAALHESPQAAVALAWLSAHGAVPLASARTPEQLTDLLRAGELSLSEDDLSLLDSASDPR
jgi:aryl-alcohol dehydrogenase-like predicted oxidoreductase